MRRPAPAPEDAAARGAEQAVSRVLLWGGLLSIALIVLGLLLFAARGGFHHQAVVSLARADGERQPDVFVSIGQVARGLRAQPLDPLAVMALGLVLLLGTPVLGVAVAIPVFLFRGDYRYALIGAVVLAMLAVAMVLSGGLE